MDYLRSTSDLLADRLRAAIHNGELANPLPNIREWSLKLSVSRTTLGRALKKLSAEGLVTVRPRQGAMVCHPRPRASRRWQGQVRLVRTLYYGPAQPHVPLDLDWFISLSEQLQQHEIHLTLEKCTVARLRAISQQGERPNVMFLLLSLPAVHQKRFARWTRSALLLGNPGPKLEIPFVATDIAQFVRHATLTLLQHGFRNISLMSDTSRAPGLLRATETFLKACSEWPREPVRGKVILVPLEIEPMVLTVQRFAARVLGRHGLIVVRPVSLPAVLTALLAKGISIPDQVEVVSVESACDTVKSCPSVCHYPFPLAQFVKAIAEAALHYFDTGNLPQCQKRILVEPVPALRRR